MSNVNRWQYPTLTFKIRLREIIKKNHVPSTDLGMPSLLSGPRSL